MGSNLVSQNVKPTTPLPTTPQSPDYSLIDSIHMSFLIAMHVIMRAMEGGWLDFA